MWPPNLQREGGRGGGGWAEDGSVKTSVGGLWAHSGSETRVVEGPLGMVTFPTLHGRPADRPSYGTCRRGAGRGEPLHFFFLCGGSKLCQQFPPHWMLCVGGSAHGAPSERVGILARGFLCVSAHPPINKTLPYLKPMEVILNSMTRLSPSPLLSSTFTVQREGREEGDAAAESNPFFFVATPTRPHIPCAPSLPSTTVSDPQKNKERALKRGLQFPNELDVLRC